MGDQPIVDQEALDRLREWGGDKLLNQMLKLFLENSAERMNQIRSGVADNDATLAERGAHSLKSSAANVGLGAVRRFAAEMEAAAGASDVAKVAELLPGLEEAYAQGHDALASMIEEAEE